MDTKEPQKLRGICWALTTKCNLCCPHCYAYQSDNDEQNVDHLRILEKVKSLGIPLITFAGGEPLLCSQLPALVRHAKLIGLYTNLATNGLLLSSELIRYLTPFLDELTLPLEGSLQEIHALNRGNGSEKQFHNTISLLKEVKELPFRTAVGTVMTAHNLDDLSMLAELLLALRVRRWKIYRFYPLASSKNRKYEYLVSNKAFYKISEQLKPFIPDIDIVIVDNNLSTSPSYVMLTPTGNITIVKNEEYATLGNIMDCSDILRLLTLNAFNFSVHCGRKYRDQQ